MVSYVDLQMKLNVKRACRHKDDVNLINSVRSCLDLPTKISLHVPSRSTRLQHSFYVLAYRTNTRDILYYVLQISKISYYEGSFLYGGRTQFMHLLKDCHM